LRKSPLAKWRLGRSKSIFASGQWRNNVNERELILLRRLKEEKADLLYRCLNLKEAFIALLRENDLAAG
jgi:hypothetical protein